MATQGNKKALSGTIGNVVFRNVNGRQIVVSRPSHVKQTTATKKSASEFGQCSHWAKHLRTNLAPLLNGLTDSTMHSRFTTDLYNAIKSNTALQQGQRTPLNSNLEALKGFEFNTHSPFAHYFKPSINVGESANHAVNVTLPFLDPTTDIVFPKGCNTAKLILFALATDCSESTPPLVFHAALDLNKDHPAPAQTLLTTGSIPAGHLVLVAAKLLYFTPNLLTGSNFLNRKEFSPTMVVGCTAIQ